MADPNIGNGHIDIANEVADKLCSFRLNGQEWQIVWVILRKTWGWLTNPKDKNSPKKKMDRISLSQFTKLSGINRCRCHKLLKGLIEKQIIKKTVTQKYNTQQISYGFQSDYDKWKVLPKSATVTQKCNGVLPKSTTKLLPKNTTTKDILKDTLTKDTAFDNADFFITKNKRKITGKRLETFMEFWDAFDFKRGRAESADVWLGFSELTNNIVKEIITAAKIEAKRRPGLIANGGKPKMAQGWLSGRRWEDEIYTQAEVKEYQPTIQELIS